VMHGQIGGAFQANSGGALLGVLAIVAGPWMLVSGMRGRWWIGSPNEWVVLGIALFVVVTTVCDWAIRIVQ
jgi:hypothetical protein